jgi:sec-independent protein translocase protein TatA
VRTCLFILEKKMGLSATHLIIATLVAVLLLGRGKISALMGDVGKGIKSFKDGIAEEASDSLDKHRSATIPKGAPIPDKSSSS